jgi:hypothetical protein
VHKLVKCPVFKEVPVRKCTVEWVCPNCSNSAEPGPTSAPPAAPGTPTLVVPPPPPPKVPDAAPMPPPAIGPHKAP